LIVIRYAAIAFRALTRGSGGVEVERFDLAALENFFLAEGLRACRYVGCGCRGAK
jgi:hypothetical protein